MEITGVIRSGAGKGAFFTQVEWVVSQCEHMLGYRPFPGTLNVHVLESDLAKLDSLFCKSDFELVPDDPAFCAAQVKKVMVNGIPGAVILPSEDVRIHTHNVIEVISARALKEALGVSDGDSVKVSW
jgi:riboflavin kinase, archaea type